MYKENLHQKEQKMTNEIVKKNHKAEKVGKKMDELKKGSARLHQQKNNTLR